MQCIEERRMTNDSVHHSVALKVHIFPPGTSTLVNEQPSKIILYHMGFQLDQF